MQLDLKALGKMIADLISEAVDPLEKEAATLRQRVAELEARQPMKGERGDPGKDAEAVDIQDVVRELLASDELQSLVELRTKEAVSAIPAPKDGAPGKDGEPGPRGEKGERGDPGPKGEDGQDGVGLAGAMIDRDGTLIITTTKGEAVRLGNVVGRDGADGMGFDDMDAVYDGERGVVLRFTRGERKKEFSLHLPVIIDRGYWREGFRAKQGDAVTLEGTLWIALRDTSSKPSLENKDDWRIGARKGRDGRNGRDGRDAPGAVKLEPASA